MGCVIGLRYGYDLHVPEMQALRIASLYNNML